jgi:hypothetical protein
MSYDAFAPTGRFPRPEGRPCSACGRTETDAAARFCGVCGAVLHDPPVHDPRPARPVHDDPHPAPSVPASATAYGPRATIDYHDPPAHLPAPGVPAAVPRPSSASYAIPYVGFAALARVGAAVSAAFALLPCLVFAFAGSWLVHWLRSTLDFWSGQRLNLPVIGSFLGSTLSLNFVTLLRLEGLHDLVTYWDDRLVLAFALLWVGPWLLAIVGGAVFAGILALVYNAFGRLAGGVEVEIVPRR